MKKIFLLIALVMLSIEGYAQKTNKENQEQLDILVQQILDTNDYEGAIDLMNDRKKLESLNKDQASKIFKLIKENVSDQDNEEKQAQLVDSLVQQIQESLDFTEAKQLLECLETNSALDKKSLAELSFDLYKSRKESDTALGNTDWLEEFILTNSQDSIFQETYASSLLVNNMEEALFSYWDKLLYLYPTNKVEYLWQKGRYYLYKDEYLNAEPIYEEVIRIDKNKAFAYMDIGYFGMKYAENIYYNGRSYDNYDKDVPKNKKEALPYFIKSIKNMRKAYDLFSDEERCNTHVLVFLNDLCVMLIEDGVMTKKEIDQYFKGMDFSNYYCS